MLTAVRKEPQNDGARQILDALHVRRMTMQEAEQRLGMSKGYLSKLVDKTPEEAASIGVDFAIRARDEFGVAVESWAKAPAPVGSGLAAAEVS